MQRNKQMPCGSKIASGRHTFLNGKPATTYGYSAPILGPVVRVRNGDDVEMTIENALDFIDSDRKR
jgi:cuproxidase